MKEGTMSRAFEFREGTKTFEYAAKKYEGGYMTFSEESLDELLSIHREEVIEGLIDKDAIEYLKENSFSDYLPGMEYEELFVSMDGAKESLYIQQTNFNDKAVAALVEALRIGLQENFISSIDIVQTVNYFKQQLNSK